MKHNSYNPVTADPSPIEFEFPAEMRPLVIESHGSNINGIVYLAQGAGPHPTAVMLHGFPGHERNLDLAQAIRRAGWNAVYFNYRGSWGSEGDYSWPHVIEDARAALAFLRAKGAKDYRVDPETIVLIGHSMGGACAFAVAIQEPSVQYVANLAGANWGRLARTVGNDPVFFETVAANLEAMARPLIGFSGRAFLNDLVTTHDQYDVETNAKILAEKVILLVGGARDKLTTPDKNYWPMLQALQEANALRLTHQIFDDDHVFSSHRIALAELVVSWLKGRRQGVKP